MKKVYAMNAKMDIFFATLSVIILLMKEIVVMSASSLFTTLVF